MRREIVLWVGLMVLILAPGAGAGVIALKNGTTFQGTPTGDLILVSTGRDLLEVLPETLLSLKAGEIHLKDGRVISGTVVGGRLRFKTDLGEVAVALSDLAEYREPGPVGARAAQPAPSKAAPAAPLAPLVAAAPSPAPTSSPTPRAVETPTASPAPARPTPPPVAAVPLPPPSPSTAPQGERLFRAVFPQTGLYAEATSQSMKLGVVRRGETVSYVDLIDRRISVLGRILDLGHWIKVRTASGKIGWVEADALHEVVREGTSARRVGQ